MQIDLIPVIVGFRKVPGRGDIDMITRLRGQIKRVYTLINAIAVKIPPPAIEALRRNPNVEYVEIDEKVFATTVEQPYQIDILQQIIPWGIYIIGAINVHPYTKGTGVRIAVIDTGIDYTHPDLSINYKGGHNFVTDTTDPMDDNGHGTHVSGTIAAIDNNIGVVGVSPGAYIYAIKVLDSTGSGYTSDVIAGIQWSVDSAMKIANMSLGSKISSKSLKSACDTAYKRGLLLVAAAGNSGNALAKGNNVDYPARYDSVIAVVATDANNVRAWWSSTGSAVELSAPGVDIQSTLPGNRYGIGNGTSMASPHVTGVAALILSYNPTFTNVQTRVRMQITASDIGTTGKDNLYGYGLVNAYRAVLGT